MKKTKIEQSLLELSQIKDFDELITAIKEYKAESVKTGNQEEAKRFWVFEQIVEIHKLYSNAFYLLKEKKYYEGWCQLERVEITFSFLKKHFSFENNQYNLFFIEKAVRNLQVIFPYRLFSSVELLKKEMKCSICDRKISVRNPCGHIVGEIYNGEQCCRIVTECDVLGIALVENPVNKFSVPFTVDPETNEQVDHYNYDTIDYIIELVQSPYEPWDLEIHKVLFPHSYYSQFAQEDFCPCGSGEKYKDCCILKAGVEGLHYEFIVKEPTAKRFISNTVKQRRLGN